MLQKIKIGTRLALAFAVLLLLISALAARGISGAKRLTERHNLAGQPGLDIDRRVMENRLRGLRLGVDEEHRDRPLAELRGGGVAALVET